MRKELFCPQEISGESWGHLIKNERDQWFLQECLGRGWKKRSIKSVIHSLVLSVIEDTKILRQPLFSRIAIFNQCAARIFKTCNA